MLALALALSAAPAAHTADLVLEDETVELSGSWTFDRVVLRDGATIQVAPYDGSAGSAGSGTARLHATTILVEAGARTDATDVELLVSGGSGLCSRTQDEGGPGSAYRETLD